MHQIPSLVLQCPLVRTHLEQLLILALPPVVLVFGESSFGVKVIRVCVRK